MEILDGKVVWVIHYSYSSSLSLRKSKDKIISEMANKLKGTLNKRVKNYRDLFKFKYLFLKLISVVFDFGGWVVMLTTSGL